MSSLFPFVQLELSQSIGPPPGRYVVGAEGDGLAMPTPAEIEEAQAMGASGHDVGPEDSSGALIGVADVLLVQVRGAPPPKPRMFRRGLAPQVENEEPRELSVTVVTVVLATQMFDDEPAAKDWLRQLRASPELQEDWVSDAMSVINLAIVAYRACAADPYVVELSRADPRAVRIGYGPAQDVALGGWSAAIGVLPPPPPRVNRQQQLMPTQGMAAILAGQATVLESEELVLRALLDIQHHRFRAAAVGLSAGLGLLLGEVSGEVLPGKVQQRMDDVLAERRLAEDLASAARRGPLTESEIAALQTLSETVGALIDQRRYVPMGF